MSSLATDPTYVTIADGGYFLGAVALVNSLRLTGNGGQIVIVDAGLTADQRKLLSTMCDVRPVPVDRPGVLSLYFKATIGMLGLRGVVVLIDSDMIATGSLAPLHADATGGALCVFPDTSCPDRRFEDWRATLGIAAPLREQTYVNTGLVALDVTAWGATLHRWWELCDRARDHRSKVAWGVEDPAVAARDPFLWGDQDVLNAILMTETGPERLRLLDPAVVGVPHWPDYDAGAKVVDRRALAVEEDGRPLALLHYWDHPKPWAPGARMKLTSKAYTELLARLLWGEDVPLRVPRAIVPTWLRDDVVGRLVRRGPRSARRSARRAVSVLPGPLEDWATAAGRKLVSRQTR